MANMILLFVSFFILALSAFGKQLESCGNSVCEPAKGETWSNCVHDCCTTPDCDKEDNDVNHKPPPAHPGVGHIHNRKARVYRYHDEN
jgi:hypothetical protein